VPGELSRIRILMVATKQQLARQSEFDFRCTKQRARAFDESCDCQR
jgi:hypothetical protein